jgi:hypothetical protein
MNFKLKTPKSKDSSLILSYVTLSNGTRFVYSTGEKIPLRLWDTNSQLPKKTKSQNDQVIVNRVNLKLDKLRFAYLELDLSYKTANKILNKEILKQEFDILLKGAKFLGFLFKYKVIVDIFTEVLYNILANHIFIIDRLVINNSVNYILF